MSSTLSALPTPKATHSKSSSKENDSRLSFDHRDVSVLSGCDRSGRGVNGIDEERLRELPGLVSTSDQLVGSTLMSKEMWVKLHSNEVAHGADFGGEDFKDVDFLRSTQLTSTIAGDINNPQCQVCPLVQKHVEEIFSISLKLAEAQSACEAELEEKKGEVARLKQEVQDQKRLVTKLDADHAQLCAQFTEKLGIWEIKLLKYDSLLRESERKRCESQMRCDPLISAFNPILPVASSFVLQDPPINRSLPSPLQLSSVPSRVLAPSQVRTLTPTPIRPSPSARRLAPSTPNRVSAVSKLATMAESPINTNTGVRVPLGASSVRGLALPPGTPSSRIPIAYTRSPLTR